MSDKSFAHDVDVLYRTNSGSISLPIPFKLHDDEGGFIVLGRQFVHFLDQHFPPRKKEPPDQHLVALGQAIDRLRLEERDLYTFFHAHVVGKLSFGELAAYFSCSRSTARSRVEKARAKLERYLS